MNKKRQRGQGLAETALVLPLLIVILGGLFEIGRAFLILIAAENAAAEGALYGSVHPECLASDHAVTICQNTESVSGRVIEEGRPLLSLADTDIVIEIEGDGTVSAGNTLRVDVQSTFAPITPLGHWLWGETAEVFATARQKILSPPKPGYTY